MQRGKPIIGRGMQAAGDVVQLRRDPETQARLDAVRAAPPPRPAEPPAHPHPQVQAGPLPFADYHLVRERLDALERLSLLRDVGALTAEEFAVEKTLVLRLPAEELLLEPAEMLLPPRGPSLLGRLLSWKILVLGALVGLGYSAYTAPHDLMNIADRLSRLIG